MQDLGARWGLDQGKSGSGGWVSQTQTLITHISCLCQEICDIKRQNKNQSNSTPKDEPREGATLTRVQEEKTMDSNQCQDCTSIDGTDGSSCTYSSHSTLPPRSEHSHDIPHIMEHLIHSCSPHCLKAIKSSLLPDPPCYLMILSYQPHPLLLSHMRNEYSLF